MPQKKQAKRPKLTMGHILRGLAVFTIFFAMVGSIIYSQLELNELNTALQKVDKQLSTAQSEYVQLQMASASKASTADVEKYAVNVLGMQKLDASQIEYIRLNESDKIEVSAQNEEKSFFGRIADWFSGIF